jgi:hypothetical protein
MGDHPQRLMRNAEVGVIPGRVKRMRKGLAAIQLAGVPRLGPEGSAASVNLAAVFGSSVTVWGINPLLIQVTVVPRATVTMAGWNSLEFAILIVRVEVAPEDGSPPAVVGEPAEVLVQAMISDNAIASRRTLIRFMDLTLSTDGSALGAIS